MGDPGGFFGIELGKRAIFAQRRGLEVTGHNVSNAGTEGYSRQRVELTTMIPYTDPALNRPATPGQIGTGVTIDQIVRLRDKFLDLQYREEYQTLGRWEVRDIVYTRIQEFFNEPSDSSIRQSFDEFWSALEALHTTPEDPALRESVREKALTLSNLINYISSNLHTYRTDLNEEIAMKVSEINSYIDQIADLNRQIQMVKGLGDNPNDLQDQQDLLIEKLSKMIDVDVSEDPKGGVVLTVNGVDVIRGGIRHYLVLIPNPANNGMYDVRWDFEPLSFSSDPDVAIGYASPIVGNTQYVVSVIQLANELPHMIGDETASIVSEDITFYTLGWLDRNERGDFSLKVDDGPVVSIYIDGEDSLKTVMNKINAAFYNESLSSYPTTYKEWLTASIARNDNGSYYLVLRSNELGEDYRITVLGDMVSIAQRLGLWDGVATNDIWSPQDAIFSVNGEIYRSSRNRFREAKRVSTGEYETVVDGMLFELQGIGTTLFRPYFPAQNGELLGYLESRDEILINYINLLDEFSYTLIKEFNAQHRAGYGLNQDKNGIDFFNEVYSVEGASSLIALSDDINDYPEMIATAADDNGVNSGPGDGSIANKLASIRYRNLMRDGKVNLNQFLEATIAKLGVESQEASRMSSNQELLVKQVDNRRQEVMGVSLDEEMTELVKYQHAFYAAARFINAMDEVYNRVVNNLGLVGR
ncbi:MAG: flagellar hook-associated protein FlgK [Synergistetes bacterium]|nr:flagellar hook-associated protein FlgK [Synergistota bacterium]